ncbi:S-adenosyl-L-methionine-dependent methyltransferase [Aspergillus sclerotioniger CBS 115572]|uniref:S-adenosyl-L-methionine-dependent methyltransferase n=1 Tax=Aspergillus sclerotioniger CBS 115572 TaxID=1450535 RepID=A0A317URY4_9EURO|nr:S-adenosyl-L-methionine-dependent methyltransferase [Aspergillus sclerotioniger CBS 115572]PWY64783.1 S-adenosyl-L-methionine-dependent methyltransferase [Aspergillus sclerotioniger CBS 115572]
MGELQNNQLTVDLDVDHIAVSPGAPDQIVPLVLEINNLTQAFTAGQTTARQQLLEVVESLLAAVETPREAIGRHCWRSSTGFAAITTAIDLGIFRLLAESDQPKSVHELAHATGADILLLHTFHSLIISAERIMKHLGAINAVIETENGEYACNNFSHTLAHTKYADSFPVFMDCFYPTIFAIPKFLQQTNYRNPTNNHHSPFQLGIHTTHTFFEALADNPVLSAQFNNHMSIYHKGRTSWMDPGFYPVDQLQGDCPLGKEDIFLVDVGGGKGHDLNELCTKWPTIPGRLILQDLPAVIAEATDLHPSIECMAHDFFTEQPVKGARAYFLHSILHDWPDDDCLQILAPLKAAMVPGVSRLLINENVVTDHKAPWYVTSLDLILMADFAGTERTEAQWRGLLTEAGFRVVKIWTADRWSESLIECEVEV